jgi:hypothetical protein
MCHTVCHTICVDIQPTNNQAMHLNVIETHCFNIHYILLEHTQANHSLRVIACVNRGALFHPLREIRGVASHSNFKASCCVQRDVQAVA